MKDLSLWVYNRIKEEFDKVKSAKEWKGLFSALFFDKKHKWGTNAKFINKVYNPIVLEKKQFTFQEFKYGWSLQGMTKSFMKKFNDNFKDNYLSEMGSKKDIVQFLNDYCEDEVKSGKKKHKSFCSKLWHCMFPEEYPIMDSVISKKLKIVRYDFETRINGMIKGYKMYIEKEQEKLKQIREALSDDKFAFVRINELTDVRLIDMGLWGIGEKQKLVDRDLNAYK